MSGRTLILRPLGAWSAWWRRGEWAHAAWLLGDPEWAPLGYAPYAADGGEAAALANATTGVVLRDHWRDGAAVLLARRTAPDRLPGEAAADGGESPDGAFDLRWLVALHDPAAADALWHAAERRGRRAERRALGEALRRHAAPVLRGDFTVFAALQALYAGLGVAAAALRARGLAAEPGRELTALAAAQEAVVADVRARFADVLGARARA